VKCKLIAKRKKKIYLSDVENIASEESKFLCAANLLKRQRKEKEIK
jgi:hypothetical protein